MENTCDDDLLPLPLDVLIQILVFLPVISLLRFKSVCKSWRALIESSFFIDLHANTLPPNNSSSSKFGTFIFQTSRNYFDTSDSVAFMLSGDGGGGGGGEDYEFEKLKLEDLGFPPCNKVSQSKNMIIMVGSCNGLICLHDIKWRDVSLWNPATRQFRLLPKSLTLAGIGIFHEDFVAFGYDVKTDDYKVLQVSRFRPYMSERWLTTEEYIFRVQVYNLSTDSWRLLEGINSFPALPKQALGLNHGVYLNTSYYFYGIYSGDIEIENTTQAIIRHMILSFDFTKESFTTIPLPHDYHLSQFLTYLGEKLAIFAQVGVRDECHFDSYDICVLNEHDVEEPWTKLHSIEPYVDGRPRGISNNGEFALIDTNDHIVVNYETIYTGKLKLFNLVTKEIKKEFHTGYGVIRADVYKQSLVSIGGNGATTDRVIGGTM